MAGINSTLSVFHRTFADARPPLFVRYDDIITQCASKARFVCTDFIGE